MNKLKNNDILIAIKTIPKVFSLLKKCDKKYLIIMVLEVIAFSIDKYPALFIMKYTISALTRQVQYETYLWNILPLIVLMLLLKLLRVYINTSRPVRDQVITEKLFNVFFTQCMKIDYQTLESKEMQDKKELAKYIANGKIAAVGWYFVEMFSSLIALIIATIFLMRINMLIIVIVFIGLIVKSFITKKILNKTTPISKQQKIDNRFLNYLYSVGSDYEYVKEFRIFNFKENLSKKINVAKKEHIASNEKLQKYSCINNILYNIQDFIVKISSFAIMGLYYIKNLATLSDFTFVIGLVNDYISYSNSITQSCKSYIESTTYIDHYIQFISESNVEYGNKLINKNILNHTIEFKNVSFTYPNSQNYAIQNINLKIKTPTKVSLVGKNGAGKSTLIKLLLRLYKPNKGEILLDGINIYEYSENDYMSEFSSVFQDFVLFAFTVEENITSLNVSDINYFNNIIHKTEVFDFINNYPDKYKTFITNSYSSNGVEFSGGEQQKMALARSVYKNTAEYFILDEPTSTYDADAEYKLYCKYEELLLGKTSIFISHRLSSCKLSDKIVLLENGSIIEEGNHDELMAKQGGYYNMFKLQANQYKIGANGNA